MGKRIYKHVIWSLLVLTFLTGWLLTACTKGEERLESIAKQSVSTQSPLIKKDEPKLGATDLSTAIVRVAEQTIPAVAHIEVTQRQEVANPFLPL